jgi:hypothetical protein
MLTFLKYYAGAFMSVNCVCYEIVYFFSKENKYTLLFRVQCITQSFENCNKVPRTVLL